MVDQGAIVHSYPFCWRSDTPLIYKAVPSWFVKVEEIKPQVGLLRLLRLLCLLGCMLGRAAASEGGGDTHTVAGMPPRCRL